MAGEVILATPDLSAIPPERGLLLTDLDTGRCVELRTVHSLRLQLRERASRLVVSSLSALPTRGGGAEIRFVLTADATCDVSVMNIAGRPVREIVRSRVHAAGQQVILWDGRNGNGLPVPSGRYLVRVRANSTTGESTQALSSALITR